jgi:hypothetical protein
MNLIVTLYSALLFFLLVPGILVSFPPKKSKFVVAGFHAIVFALVWHFTHKLVWQMSLEGFSEDAGQAQEMAKGTAKGTAQGTAQVTAKVPEPKLGDKCNLSDKIPSEFKCKDGKLAKAQ